MTDIQRMKISISEHRCEVGQNIMLAREALGLQPKQFGEPVGLKSSALWNIETGKAYPSVYMIAKLCEEYGFTADYFLFGRRSSLPDSLLKKIRAAQSRQDVPV